MNLTCPCCHAKYPLEAALDGEAAGELQLILAQAGPLARPLIAYLGLFRSRTRALSFDRAVRLAGEALALTADRQQLAVALAETIEALRAKRDQGQVEPLTGHGYLKKVLKTVGASLASAQIGHPQGVPLQDPDGPPRGKRAQAIASLADWGQGDWLRGLIADGLAALVCLGLDSSPGADVICRTADVWYHVMAASCSVETLDSTRVKAAFSGLLKDVEKWPEPKAIWAHMACRPQQDRLPEPPRSEDACQLALKGLAQMRQRVAGCMGLPSAELDEEARRKQLHQQARQLAEEN
ncbi:MAG: hypothetical protein AB7D06_17135 [Pedobacter sp.]